jgi:RNA polymerase sigma factor for flagellar operon FliA
MIPLPSEYRPLNGVREEEELARYMPIVHQTAATLMKRLPVNVQRDDLVAAGTFGLLDSLRRSCVTDGAAFECYVRIRIRGAMVDELRAQDWLPRRVRKSVSRAAEAEGAHIAVVVGFDDASSADPMMLADSQTRTPIEEAVASAERKLVECAVGKLPPRERTVVRMHYFSGVKFKEIGAMLRVSEPRVSQLHSRALHRLRDMLASELAAA